MKTKIQNLLLALAIFAGINHIAAQSTAFTYQGRLNNGANPANGNYDLAISDYTKATGINPNLPQAYNNRGGAYINKGNNDQAILDCSKAIALYPNYADAFNNRGTAYYHKKEYDKAWADVNKAEKLGASVDPQFLKDLKKASGRDN